MSHTETDFPTPFDNAEVPFLVTHWLANLHGANFLANNGENRDERSRRDAIRRIRRAAVDIASAFTDLGAFGVSSRVRPLEIKLFSGQSRNSQYRYDSRCCRYCSLFFRIQSGCIAHLKCSMQLILT